MDASMWVAKTGLDAQQTRMNVISNNLANVNTTGFKEIVQHLRIFYTKPLEEQVVKSQLMLRLQQV